jgi:serine/threonine-protein kinase
MTATIHCAGCQHAYIETALFCPNCGRPKVREALADPLLGTVLGERFLVHEKLGQGGSGTIYRAEHVTLRRKVAIKVLHTELSRDDLAVERFRREATTVAEIDNEHIVEIHDFGRTHDGRLYLAMELLEGETLDGVLARDKQLSVERAADILIQVGEALMEAHAIGYVHRDLRPRNIYLSVRRGKANFIKLLDFGLAKLVETEGQAASTSLGMTFGDPRYMSPEQARGDRIDRRADIYQLGCVAYEILTGAPPFAGNRVFDILTKQVTEAPQPLPTRRPGIPLWMEAAVTKMLAKDPDNRFATTTRMVEALRRGLETGEVMEDDVARRRESIPPPSVSRVMQRMGLQPSGEPRPAPAPEAAPPAPVAAPVLPASQARPAPPPADPGLRPGVTMRSPIVPPPSKPDSVELLRKRTGTPRIGVPIGAPIGAPAPGAAPAVQPPVAGTIDSHADVPSGEILRPPGRPVGIPAPRESTSRMDPVAPAPRSPTSSPPRAAAVVVEPPPEGPDDGQAPGKRGDAAAADLNISQVWYDEGDQLSDDDDAPRARKRRAPKASTPSATDLSLDGDYEERPRRRWGLVAGIGVFALIGATVAFALTRGGSSTRQSASLASRDQPSAPAAPGASPASIDVAPSTIISTDPPATETPAAVPTATVPAAAATPPPAAAATPPPVGAHRPVETHAPAEAHAPAGRRPAESGGYPILGSEPTRRPPSLGNSGTGTSTPTPVVTPPEPSKVPKPPSLTDGPKDPYGGDDAPSDGVAPEKKAEFFANVGAQQLINGDTAGAAANFKKALELDRKNVPATTGMGEIALRQGLFGDAIAHLSRAAKLAPRSSKVLTLLGEAYLNSGNNAQAAAQFKKALQLDPDNARARDGYNEASSRVPPPSDE